MRVISEERYKAQLNLKVYRIRIDDNEIAQIKLISETNYLDFKDEVDKIIPHPFEKYKLVIDILDLVNKIIIVSVWKQNDS